MRSLTRAFRAPGLLWICLAAGHMTGFRFHISHTHTLCALRSSYSNKNCTVRNSGHFGAKPEHRKSVPTFPPQNNNLHRCTNATAHNSQLTMTTKRMPRFNNNLKACNGTLTDNVSVIPTARRCLPPPIQLARFLQPTFF